MPLPHSHSWTPLQRSFIVGAIVTATVFFGALIYVYECCYRGPGQSALFGTWECTSGCYYHVYFRLNADHNVQALDEDGATVIYRGRWYAGGDFLYLRFIGEDIPQKHPITIWRIEDLSSTEMRLRSGDIIHTMTRVRPASPDRSNKAMLATSRGTAPLSMTEKRSFQFTRASTRGS